MNMPWCNTIGVMWYMFISQEIWAEKCQFQIILLFVFKVTQRLPTYQHPGGKGRDDRVTRRWLWSLFLWALQGAHIQRKRSAFFKKVCFVPIQQLGWNKRTSSFEWNGWLVVCWLGLSPNICGCMLSWSAQDVCDQQTTEGAEKVGQQQWWSAL